jgi:thiol-disulfide isomerase/thioredoxin
MLYLVAVAIVLGLLNLVLTVGVIRRLREHTELLSGGPGKGPDLVLGVGESPDSFTATTIDEEQISSETLAGEQLVGFFATTCGPCKEKAPLFAERAALGGRSQALAVVVGEPDETAEFVTLFQPVARVVVESDRDGGVLGRTFKVKGFPAICTLDGDGMVTASGAGLLSTSKSPRSPRLVS